MQKSLWQGVSVSGAQGTGTAVKGLTSKTKRGTLRGQRLWRQRWKPEERETHQYFTHEAADRTAHKYCCSSKECAQDKEKLRKKK